MPDERTLEKMAREVIDSNRYMVLGTQEPTGQPRVSPVYFSPVDYTDFYWVSSATSHHSRNITEHPDISIVIFDSSAEIGQGRAVYMSAVAGQVPDEELAERCAAAFRTSFAGVRAFTPDELREPDELRLYCAKANTHEVHIRGGDPDFGTGIDTRRAVTLSG